LPRDVKQGAKRREGGNSFRRFRQCFPRHPAPAQRWHARAKHRQKKIRKIYSVEARVSCASREVGSPVAKQAHVACSNAILPMKYFMLVGGFAGFALTFTAGVLVGNDIDGVLVDAGIGCLVGAGLMRGFRHLYIHSLRSVVLERARQNAKAMADESAPDATPAV
jgi:hypothetical protein